MRRRTAVLVLGALVTAAAATGWAINRGPAGAATAEKAAQEYVDALADEDRGRLSEIADPDHESDPAIQQALRELGGDKLTVEQIRIDDTESDHTKRATLSGERYSGEIWLQRHEDRWFVVLGDAKGRR